jgi:signal transduction histidine kinase
VVTDAQAIVDLLPDLVLLVATDGTVIGGNPALYRALGMTSASLVGRSLYELIDAPDRAADYLRRCAASRQPFPGALVFRGPDGTRLECRCDGARSRLRDHTLGPILLRCRRKIEATSRFTLLNQKIADLTREIVARRAAEEALHRFTDTLEQRVAERTRQLTEANEQLVAESGERRKVEEALRQAQKMEAIGQLTGGVAHDFNNLLTVVSGNLDLLETQINTSRGEQLIAAARRGVERGARLTQSLLAFARKQPLRPEVVNPNQLIAAFAELLRRATGDTVKLQLVLTPTLDPCPLDPAQFEAALLNLVVNARDAMPQGGKVTIETQNVTIDPVQEQVPEIAPGRYVLVSVADTGIGMTAAQLARAFDPFFTTKDVGKGSGLGLSQVYGFVKQSGGHVAIASEPQAGTTVRVYLPALQEQRGELPVTEPASLPATGGRELVLVVDDDADVRELTVANLEQLGYQVRAAADGAEALVVLRSGAPFDLLVSDVMMPNGLLGDELARQACVIHPGLRVLLTSGYHQPRSDGATATAPEFPLLAKPYSRNELASAMRRVLDGPG